MLDAQGARAASASPDGVPIATAERGRDTDLPAAARRLRVWAGLTWAASRASPSQLHAARGRVLSALPVSRDLGPVLPPQAARVEVPDTLAMRWHRRKREWTADVCGGLNAELKDPEGCPSWKVPHWPVFTESPPSRRL